MVFQHKQINDIIILTFSYRCVWK